MERLTKETGLLCHDPEPYDGRSELSRQGFVIPHPQVATRLHNDRLRKPCPPKQEK